MISNRDLALYGGAGLLAFGVVMVSVFATDEETPETPAETASASSTSEAGGEPAGEGGAADESGSSAEESASDESQQAEASGSESAAEGGAGDQQARSESGSAEANIPEGATSLSKEQEKPDQPEADQASGDQPSGGGEQAADGEQPSGEGQQVSGGDQLSGDGQQAAGSDQPSGEGQQAAGSEQPSGEEQQAAGSEQPSGEEQQASGSSQPVADTETPLRAGQTTTLADGAIRAFVSQVHPDSQRVNVAINGQKRTWLELQTPQPVEGTNCALLLTGIEGNMAMLTADCGGEGEGASAQAGSDQGGTGKGAPAGSDGGGDTQEATLRAGQTQQLAGGKIRAFISQVHADSQRVNVAINGQKRSWLEIDSPLPVEGTGCAVVLTGVEGNAATLEADCDGQGGSGAQQASSGQSGNASGQQQGAPDGGQTDQAANASGGDASGQSARASDSGASGSGSGADGKALRAGQTATLADGAIRAFVSQVDGDRARVAVNGQTRSWIESGQPLDVEGSDCRLILTGVQDGAAMLDADCGGQQPASAAGENGSGGSAASGQQAAGSGAGGSGSDHGGKALGVGQTATLADGAIRAFVSQIDGDRARLAVNGQTRTWVDRGASLEVEGSDCRLILTDVQDRGAMLDADCGGQPSASAAGESGSGDSAASGQQAGSGDSANGQQAAGSGAGGSGSDHGGKALGIGQTATLADGAIRAFVSQIDGDRARLAVNGQTRTWLDRGASLEVEGSDCRLILTDVQDRGAMLDADCGQQSAGAGEQSGSASARKDGSSGSGDAQRSGGDGSSKSARASGDGGSGSSGQGDDMLSPGQTRSVGDKLRVFVSSVDPDGERVRVAVNGQETVWIKSGETHDVGDGCSVSIEKIDRNAVALQADCG